jgi:hypothetical protein
MIVEDFDIATDLKVEFLLPDIDGDTFILGISTLGGDDVLGGFGVFILGESLLGGTDVLGDSKALLWQSAETVVSAFDMSVGGSIDTAIYFQPEPGTARLTLQSYAWDPNVNKNIRTNTAIRLRIDNGTVDHTIFTGYIDTISVNYYPGGLNVIQINAYDIYKQIVNTRIASYDTTDYEVGYITPLQSVERVLQDTGFVVSDLSVDTAGKIPTGLRNDIIAASVLNESLEVGLGVLWVDQESEELVFTPRPENATGTASTLVIGNNHGEPNHLCLSDIVVAADADTIFNSLKVTLASDDLVSVALQDTDSIQLYGESSADVTVNVLDEEDLTRWAGDVFSQAPNKLVKQVETPTIDRLGNLTEAAIFTPGSVIGVDFTREQLTINEYYTITKVIHSIDVNVWYTTVELWKAA